MEYTGYSNVDLPRIFDFGFPSGPNQELTQLLSSCRRRTIRSTIYISSAFVDEPASSKYAVVGQEWLGKSSCVQPWLMAPFGSTSRTQFQVQKLPEYRQRIIIHFYTYICLNAWIELLVRSINSLIDSILAIQNILLLGRYGGRVADPVCAMCYWMTAWYLGSSNVFWVQLPHCVPGQRIVDHAYIERKYILHRSAKARQQKKEGWQAIPPRNGLYEVRSILRGPRA